MAASVAASTDPTTGGDSLDVYAVQSPVESEFTPAGKKRILIINTRSKWSGDEETTCASSSAVAPVPVGLFPYPSHHYRHEAETHIKESFSRRLCELDDLNNTSLPEFRVCHLNHLSHSADSQSDTWAELASLIEDEYENYCGFVVQHGKDTMVYTATALSFMLENISKPVIFTGSVIPGIYVQSDLQRNLVLALQFAQNEDLCDVCIVFGEKLFRANRTFKKSSMDLQPFASPNMPPLATLRGSRVVMEHRLLLNAPRGRLRVHLDMSALVLTIKVVPGMSFSSAMDVVASTKARAIVICGFGSGNIPVRRGMFLTMVATAVRRGVLVVVCTQNRYGSVDLGDYDTARQLKAVGAIGSGDMTIEATIVKLKFLFGRGYDSTEVRSLLLTSLRGETSHGALQTSSKI
ncbi:asparaginase-like protein, putative [Bodo saltans]|uniref:asparaginase n=1 Tax=Bodo saltans TaxID=75058 RepID=A0A0S4J4T5_BODSA|nr:asparaginase-like protein, putative [Bodo saltans]|eukprot:CUG72654.1 asparaginase-like protein, putative [Bodo saltans]